MHGILERDRLLIKAAQGSKRVSTKNQIDSVSLFYALSSEVTLCHSAMVTSPLEFWERQHRPVASWVCYSDSLTGPHPQKDPMLGLMFSCHCKCKSKILNTFQVRGPAFAVHTEPRKLCSWSHLEVKASKSCYKKSMLGLPWWLSGKESACQCRGHGFDPWSRRIPHTLK